MFAGSDHLPILLDCEGEGRSPITHRRHRFRFEAMWSREQSCVDIIRSSWSSTVNGDWNERIDNCSRNLLLWSRSVFGNFKQRRKQILGELEELAWNSSVNAASSRRTLKVELAEIAMREETMWRQRSRIQWLQEGDRNTRYFHAMTTKRQ
ncbi:hypothetical protein Cni_G05602 [Canna indica]|uniref:Endonuclease/exonuclease/phosphatase n=1 Tax=Canna indica TaxID=4628 RepID=A0AAQ3Q5N3_9LILI|nr:hypothetical protein Cni_G05602 [Canna indica]